jgi:hypothetical protein
MILDDKYITKDMLVKNTYEGNYYAKKNAVMYDLQNGKQNVVCFCDNIYTAQGIVEGLNMLDKLEADGAELHVLEKYNNARIQLADKTKDSNE